MNMLRTRIDLDAITHNVRVLKHAAGDAQLMCVVKADAYGHGVGRVTSVMAQAGADLFGVATIAEARRLRALGVELPVMAWLWDATGDAALDEIAAALADDIQLVAPSLLHLQALVDAEIPAIITMKVETGMHRGGIEPAEWQQAFSLAKSTPHLQVRGLMSHLACADEPAHPANAAQIRQFRKAIAQARTLGLEVPVNHIANSAATLEQPDAHFQQVRTGIACYGLEPVAGCEHDLRPAMTWAATVLAVKPISAGEATSYGLTWTAEQDGYLAVIPCGYADGLPRSVQGHLQVGISGKCYPQVGRVCMDQILVDLGENPFGVQAGDEAVLFGEHGMSATDLADATGTINYEIVTNPGGRTVREYEGGVAL